MKPVQLLFAALVLVSAACSTSEKETPSGLKFTVVTPGNGDQARPGQLMMVNYTLTDSKDSVWNSTYTAGMAVPVMINDSAQLSTETGLMQMFRMMSVGDSIKCTMTIKEFFTERTGGPVPLEIDSTLKMTYVFKAKEIMDLKAYQEWQRNETAVRMEKQLQADVAAIDKFLQEKNIVAEKTESGIRYVVTKVGKGETAQTSQTARVNYVGYTMEGVYFDSNIKQVAQEKGVYHEEREPYGPMDVVIDQSNVITGWHQALKLMNKGSKATFYIPSTLGWGPRRVSDQIKENQITVFDIEMLDVK